MTSQTNATKSVADYPDGTLNWTNSTNSLWARQRFQGIAALVDARRKDLMKISQDQMDFLAQRNNPRGKKTMKAYYWYICGLEWDSEHPRP